MEERSINLHDRPTDRAVSSENFKGKNLLLLYPVRSPPAYYTYVGNTHAHSFYIKPIQLACNHHIEKGGKEEEEGISSLTPCFLSKKEKKGVFFDTMR